MTAVLGSLFGAIWMLKFDNLSHRMPPLFALTLMTAISNLLIITGALFSDFTFDCNS